MLTAINQDFIRACQKGEKDKIIKLLKEGADINGFDRTGETALQNVISENGLEHVVRLLIENGADINKQSSEGHTAIMYIALDDEMDKLHYLLKQGAELHHLDQIGWGIVRWMLEHKKYTRTEKTFEVLYERKHELHPKEQVLIEKYKLKNLLKRS